SKFCLAHVVSSLGLTMAGPGAIAACREAVLREAAQLEASLFEPELSLAFNTNSLFGRVACGRNCKTSSAKRARISSSSAPMDDTASPSCFWAPLQNRFSAGQIVQS